MELKMNDNIDKRLKDKEWRMSNLYWIKNKDNKLIKFRKNRAQEHFDKNKALRNIVLKSRQLGFCLDPKTRVLTADLKWIPIKQLSVGREIVAVDEYPLEKGRGKSRRLRTAIVQKVVSVKRKAYQLILNDGRSIVCTGQHPWLTIGRSGCSWRSIEEREGLVGKIKIGTSIRTITTPWQESSDFEDGWFGGMLDGEGSMTKNTSTSSIGINISQRKGEVFKRVIKYVKDRGYNFRIENDKAIRKSKFGRISVPKMCVGRMDEIFRLIGQTRPTRFIDRRFWENRWLPGRGQGTNLNVKVKEIIPLEGEREMIDLQTSTGTYIAEGLVSHNTTYETIDSLDDVAFTENFDAIFIAQDLDTAKDIFSNKIELSWDKFKLKNLYKVNKDSARQLKLNFNTNEDPVISSITVDSSGRSGTFRRAHITEFAQVCKKFPDRAKEIIEGTIPALPLDARLDIESTAEESTGKFHDMFWEAWDRGEPTLPTQYKAHFYNWQWDDSEIAKVTDEQIKSFFSSPDYSLFKNYQSEHSLNDKEITYYYMKWLSLDRNWNSIKKEFPTTPWEAFSSSGKKVFDENALARQFIKEGKTQNQWTYFYEPVQGHEYVWGADVGEGVGKDSSTCVILDVTTLKPKVVATYKNNNVAPDIFAHELRIGLLKYLYAFGAPERNNHGHTVISKLREIYPEQQIYKDENDKYGWETNLSTKPKIIYDLNTAINNDAIEITSKILVSELRRYDKEQIRVKRYDEESTDHYDLLIALAIAYQMRTEYFVSKNTNTKTHFVDYSL